MRYKHIYIIFIISILFFNSCKLSKTVVKDDTPRRIHPISIKKLQNNVEDAYLDFEYLQFKLSAKVNIADTKYSLKGQIRIKKDSIIWINLNHATGIPVVKMLLMNDSIVFRNNISSEYYAGSYSFLEDWFMLDLNYNYFQSMLTNELFTYPDYEDIFDLKKANYKDGIDSSMYCLKSFKDRRLKRHLRKNQVADLIIQNIFINPKTFKIADILIDEFEQNRKLNISYSDYAMIDNKHFPQEVDFIISTDTSAFDLKIKYSKITIEKELDFPFQIPDKYTKIKE